LNIKRDNIFNLVMEIYVLALDKHKNVPGLNQLM
jgi:hypothetical protein